MSTSVADLVREFDHHPAVSARALRQMLDDDAEAFLDQSIDVFRTDVDSEGAAYLIRMVASHPQALERITDPRHFTAAQSLEIAQRLHAVDPGTDVRLLKLLVGCGAPPAIRSQWQTNRVLEVASRLTDCRRIPAVLANLLRHEDAYVRSKATLMMGRINGNMRWVEHRLNDPDPRVRANAIECLWGSACIECKAILLAAARDPDHRVAANAAVGLHRIGELASVRVLMALMARADEWDRAAGAWAAGETSDPRFLPILSHFEASNGPVRQNVLRALVRLRESLARRQKMPVLRVSADWDGDRAVRVEVRAADGGLLPRLPATAFVVTGRDRTVDIASVTYESPQQYTVELDVSCRTPIVIDVFSDHGRGGRRIE